MTTTTSPAVKFRGLAATAQRDAAKKRDTSIKNQNPTRRRLDMIASMEADARKLDKLAGALLGLADAWDEGSVPPILERVTTKGLVETLITYHEFPRWDASTLRSIGLDETNYAGPAQALSHLAIEVNRVDPIADQIRDAKRALYGQKIPGFFPTPPTVVARLLELADLQPGMHVLEPSAGWGNIADALAEQPIELHIIEYSQALQKILKLKGYTIVAEDFLTFDANHPGWTIRPYRDQRSGFDRIVMNPPFEQGQDIDHVRHAYDLLSWRGRLVSVVCEGPFFRTDQKSVAFREWLRELGAHIERLPEGSFEQSERSTGVATRIVSINRR